MSLLVRLGLSTALLAGSVAVASAADLLIEAPAPVAPVLSAGGLYVSAFGGAAILDDVDYTGSNGATGETYFDNGYNLDAAIGYDFGNGLSVETQLGYLNAAQTGGTYVNSPINTDVPVTGTGSVLYGMVNAWYSVDLGGITPFIGGGLGVASVTLDSTYTGLLFAPSTFKDSATTYAAQIGGGVAVAVTDNLDLVGRYRYFATGDFDVVDGQGTTLTSNFGVHLLDVGLKLAF